MYRPSYCLFSRKIPFRKENDKVKLLFQKEFSNQGYETFDLPCGKCLYCQIKYSTQWALRCVLQSKNHVDNCFITLTYNDNNIPHDKNLVKSDYQKFIKRLRKKIAPVKIKYFLAGEYGGKTLRPHYHLLVFGWKPNDLLFLKKDNKINLYVSQTINKLWNKGFISVGVDMSIKAVKYTAKYLNKLQKLPKFIKVKPFVAMSKGIAKDNFDPKCFELNGIYMDGYKYSIPRYFIKLAKASETMSYLVERWQLKNNEKFNMLKPQIEHEHEQNLYNYFKSVIVNRIGYQHLYDLKDYTSYMKFKNVEKDLKDLDYNIHVNRKE